MLASKKEHDQASTIRGWISSRPRLKKRLESEKKVYRGVAKFAVDCRRDCYQNDGGRWRAPAHEGHITPRRRIHKFSSRLERSLHPASPRAVCLTFAFPAFFFLLSCLPQQHPGMMCTHSLLRFFFRKVYTVFFHIALVDVCN